MKCYLWRAVSHLSLLDGSSYRFPLYTHSHATSSARLSTVWLPAHCADAERYKNRGSSKHWIFAWRQNINKYPKCHLAAIRNESFLQILVTNEEIFTSKRLNSFHGPKRWSSRRHTSSSDGGVEYNGPLRPECSEATFPPYLKHTYTY